MMTQTDKITIFKNRLNSIGIDIELVVNYPLVYITKINGNSVNDKYNSEHCFTLAYLPIRDNQEIQFIDLKEIFKLIRKYHELRNK